MAPRSAGPGGHGERHPADWTCRLAVVDRHKETVSFKIPCGNQTCSKNNSFMDDIPSYKLHLVRGFPRHVWLPRVSPSLITVTLWGLYGLSHGKQVAGLQGSGTMWPFSALLGGWGGECPADLRSLYIAQLAIWHGSPGFRWSVTSRLKFIAADESHDAEVDWVVYSSMGWCVIHISITTVQVCNSFFAQVCGSQAQRLLCNTVALERLFSAAMILKWFSDDVLSVQVKRIASYVTCTGGTAANSEQLA
jgi:hypothetical protein